MAVSECIRRTVKVTVSDGNHWTTEINGTIPEIRDYFRVGKAINIGRGADDYYARITRLDFIDDASKADLKRKRRR